MRLPDSLYKAVRELSEKTGRSMNSLIVQSLTEALKRERAVALYDDFTRLGQDDDSNVEFAFEAQREAVDDES